MHVSFKKKEETRGSSTFAGVPPPAALVMSYHGACPGEGPRSGWHGNENWEQDKTRKWWREWAAKEGHDVDAWMVSGRPNWMDHGEERMQPRQDPQYVVHADGYEKDWSAELSDWSPDG